MSTIKALDKLREALADCIMEAGHTDKFDTYWIVKDAADKLIDEIEAETAEMKAFIERVEKAAIARDELEVFGTAYTPLPLDADGVPIRPGDDLYDKNTNEHIPGEYVYGIGDKYVYIWHEGHNLYHGISGRYPDHFRHRPRTLEDVLRDVWKEALDYAKSDMWRSPDEVFSERADEIRVMFGEVGR